MLARLNYILLIIGAVIAGAIYLFRQYRAQTAARKQEQKIRAEATTTYGDESRRLQSDIGRAAADVVAKSAAATAAEQSWQEKLKKARELRRQWRGE